MKIFILFLLIFVSIKIPAQIDTNTNEEIKCTSPLYFKNQKDSSHYKIACYYKNDTAGTFFQGIYSWTDYKNFKKHGLEEIYYHEKEVPVITKTKGNHYYEYQYTGQKLTGWWKNGLKHGTWYYFDVYGKIILREKWKNGIKIKPSNPRKIKHLCYPLTPYGRRNKIPQFH
ncbi:MAG: hypothetical protein NT150_13550 [Bacteroidetes bacterium]|nr:hypothetical protein [Bacteroidota bacterium]